MIPIRDSVVFPGQATPLRIGRRGSIEAVRQAEKNGLWVVLVSQKKEDLKREPGPNDLHRYGTLAKIEKLRGSPENGYQALVRGTERFRVDSMIERTTPGPAEAYGWIEATGQAEEDRFDVDAPTAGTLLQGIKDLGTEILELLPSDTTQLQQLLSSIEDLGFLTLLCAANVDIPMAEKQRLLETGSVRERSLKLLEFMQKTKEQLQVQSEVREKLSHKLGKHQRDAILREQLRTIREELGDEEGAKADDLRSKIENAGMPEETLKVALDELKRLESIGSSSPESHVIRNYLDLLCALPWSKSSASADAEIDLDKARAVLEQEHYGLEKIKRRILQHLAVMKLKKTQKGSILLFVGPPGVGKTSLGQSIAKALGRKFVRASLGGVRDDAEIRGHRRTYIGAMPGRIIQSLKRAGENNPVMMLDEIDKLARSFQGDPASALLETLDPEQNNAFLDHYLDVPFDLSKIFFIATANSLESIPGPLLDRMEVIDLSGYTTAEKLHIARTHLIPKQLAEHGIAGGPDAQLQISDEALLRVITHHTREAGVRELSRKIAALCRASTEKVLAAGDKPLRVELADLEELIGAERFTYEVAEHRVPPGVATGLAWTPQGGDILFIETQLMPGSGRLTITGQLGDVMKESAQIALSLARSHLPSVLPAFDFEKKDIHVHVPAGAIPKDGPSAGVTLVTAIASLFSGRSVDTKLAMSGEVTLRGAVLPVGGIKEKILAAHRAGIERIILSARNKKDLKDVPEEVRSQLKFEFVETIDELLKLALGLELAPTWTTAPDGKSGSPAVA